MPQAKRELSGKLLNKLWQVRAKHALYREDGKWYHQLTDFPGALFDANGYIVFATERDYLNCSYLQIKKDLHVPEGISSIPGYIRVTEKKQLQNFSIRLKEEVEHDRRYSAQPQFDLPYQPPVTPKAYDLPEKPNEFRRVLAQVYRILRDTEIAKWVKFIHKYKCQICGEAIDLGNRGLYAETHHIRPLGGNHNGPDVVDNIICVCPNHHVLLDYGIILIDKARLRLTKGHPVSDEHISYHNTKIYKK